MSNSPRGTRPLVDPEILPLLDQMMPVDFANNSIDQIRQQAYARYAVLPPSPIQPDIRVIAAPGGDLEIYWYDPNPEENNRPALLHIHGGGMVMGSANTMQFGPGLLATQLRLPVASVDYRLAPEFAFPAPQEDCFAALEWLSSNALTLGVDASRIGVIGESAGGGLAAAMALMARDRGGPQLAAQFLIYAMLDHRTGSDNCVYRNCTTGEFVWTRECNQFGWQSARGKYEAEDDRRAWFSPSLADDLADLPRSWIGVGSLDLFLDENLDYARRLADAGVCLELHCYPGAVHAFNAMAEAEVSKAFHRDLCSAISRWLGLPE